VCVRVWAYVDRQSCIRLFSRLSRPCLPPSRRSSNCSCLPPLPPSLPPQKTYRAVVDLVEKDGEVQRKAQADGVGRGEVMLGDVGGALVGGQGGIRRLAALVADLKEEGRKGGREGEEK